MDETHILIVEDEAIVARNIQNRLQRMGYAAPAVAHSGSLALDQIERRQPQLVLMDIRLRGDMDGITTAERIRERIDVPVVYLTGYADDETVDRAKLTEPYGYVLKPFAARELRTTIEMALYKHQTERALRKRNMELATLNRIGMLINSSLDLDQVLATVLEEVRGLLGVTASSIWLIEADAHHLVCRQTTGRGSEIVRGWRIPVGEGVVGWVARSGQSLIVPDFRNDQRHFPEIDQETGVELRAGLSVPLLIKGSTIGVIQVLDTQVDRFQASDLILIESLAPSAAVAIENARLYQETDQLRAFNQNIVQGIHEGILLEDATGRITFANPMALNLLGYSLDSLVGLHWSALLPPEGVATVETEMPKRARGIASRYEAQLLTQEGLTFPAIIGARPLFEGGVFSGVLSVFSDISERVRAEQERERLITELQTALSKVKMLSGLLPICSSCKKIRDDQGYWHLVEEYIQQHSEADFSHGLCPDCARKLYPEIFGEDDKL